MSSSDYSTVLERENNLTLNNPISSSFFKVPLSTSGSVQPVYSDIYSSSVMLDIEFIMHKLSGAQTFEINKLIKMGDASKILFITRAGVSGPASVIKKTEVLRFTSIPRVHGYRGHHWQAVTIQTFPAAVTVNNITKPAIYIST